MSEFEAARRRVHAQINLACANAQRECLADVIHASIDLDRAARHHFAYLRRSLAQIRRYHRQKTGEQT